MDKKPKPLSIPGTKVSVQNAQLLISSGIPNLDEIIGGGYPVGTLILLQEDANSNYAKFLLKYFLAEGATVGHRLSIASKELNTKSFIKELPKRLNEEDVNKDEKASKDEMKIAFRYKNNPSLHAESGRKIEEQNFFDLSSYMDTSDLDVLHLQETEISQSENYPGLVKEIYNDLHKRGLFLGQETVTNKPKTVARIALHSIGSPSWRIRDNPEKDDEDLRKFFYTLRALLRAAYSVALVTVPSHLFNKATTERLINSSDISMRLSAFSGTELENNASLSKYHGFFYVDKIAAINSLTSKYQGPIDYAFKLLRRKFCIETLHLPPELQESTEREQDDSFGTLSCGQRSLDF